MDCHDDSTVQPERKRGQHLGPEERGAMKVLKKEGLGVRAIVRVIGCAPSTVANELKRGTLPRRSSKEKAPGYSPKQGEAIYMAHRANSHRHRKADSCKPSIAWVIRQVREHKWSLDACCGCARRQHLFPEGEMVCTRTLYNMVWAGLLPIQITELLEALKRKSRKPRTGQTKSVTAQALQIARRLPLCVQKKAIGG